MRKVVFHTTILVLVCANTTIAESSAASWYLPQDLSDKNTEVRFEVDSTWHMVEGKTAQVSGKAELVEPGDPSSVSASIIVPVASFDTDNSSRDERLREVMAAEQFPQVSFSLIKLSKGCTPALVMRDGSCQDELIGKLKIRDHESDVLIPVKISKGQDLFIIEGALPLRWADYGVEDPSIFIAKLKAVVTVFFKVTLAKPE